MGTCKDFVALGIQAASAGGAALMRYHRRLGDHQVQTKADASPVTAADWAAEQEIVAILKASCPEIPIVPEEDPGRATPTSSSRYWLVDPLDGTKGFIEGLGEFTVNVALVEENRPVVGVVYAPARDELYVAEQGSGAYRVKEGARAHLSTAAPDASLFRVVLSRRHRGAQVSGLEGGAPGELQITVMDSALKFCRIAEGKADLYLRDAPTMEWDTAAGHCIVEEAGGMLLAAGEENLRYGKPGRVNPPFLVLGDPGLRSSPWIEALVDRLGAGVAGE